jgi:uncharacterized protein YegL
MEMIPDVSLIDNAEERVPLILVLDCSGSMSGAPIQALQEGLDLLNRDLRADAKAAKSVRIKVITFGWDDRVRAGDWQDVMDFIPPALEASGRTPTGAAMQLALQEVESQKEILRQNGIAYKRPLIYLMSDGVPTDEWEPIAEQCARAQDAQKVTVFPIAVGDAADRQVLGQFSRRGAMQLDGLNFKELFLWLSASVKAVSQAVQGQAVQLPSTESWAQAIA